MSFEKISGVTVVFLTNGQIRELREGKTVSAKKFKEITNVSVQEDFVYIDLIPSVYSEGSFLWGISMKDSHFKTGCVIMAVVVMVYGCYIYNLFRLIG